MCGGGEAVNRHSLVYSMVTHCLMGRGASYSATTGLEGEANSSGGVVWSSPVCVCVCVCVCVGGGEGGSK